MSAHTPGPWTDTKAVDRFHQGIILAGQEWIALACDLNRHDRGVERDANRALIATAPDLLAALKTLSFAAQTTGGIAGRDEVLVDAIGIAERAIARAEGRS